MIVSSFAHIIVWPHGHMITSSNKHMIIIHDNMVSQMKPRAAAAAAAPARVLHKINVPTPFEWHRAAPPTCTTWRRGGSPIPDKPYHARGTFAPRRTATMV